MWDVHHDCRTPVYRVSHGKHSKYCRYHRVAGHNTEECITLKEKIEKLIQKRHIQIFVKDKDPQHDQDREQERSQKHSQTQETIEAQ